MSNFYMKIGRNISALMEVCGIDGAELSKQTGLPCSTICRLRSSAADVNPNLSSLIPIADYFCVTVSQLIGEEPINLKMYAKSKVHHVKKRSIPVFNEQTFSLYLQNPNSENLENQSYLQVDLFLSQNAFAYILQGNAMEPQFPDKSLLIIDPTLQVENLDHVLLLASGKKMPIFRQILIEGEEHYLRTLNPAFNEFIKVTQETHQILGVMVQSRKNYKENELLISENIISSTKVVNEV